MKVHFVKIFPLMQYRVIRKTRFLFTPFNEMTLTKIRRKLETQTNLHRAGINPPNVFFGVTIAHSCETFKLRLEESQVLGLVNHFQPNRFLTVVINGLYTFCHNIHMSLGIDPAWNRQTH